MRRRILAAALALLMGLLACGCEKSASGDVSLPGDAKGPLRIVCTIFPEYDWVRQILGERAGETDLTLLLKNGSDLHSYQPTVWDMAAISEADLFIYVGGESDFWVEDALANAKNPDQQTLNLMETLDKDVREEEQTEGMTGHAHDHDHEEDVHEEAEYDEHVWLSLKNAKAICGAIAEKLGQLDPEHAEDYEENAGRYRKRLDALDAAYEEAVRLSPRKTLLFGDRFPFLYLAKDYGLSYYAAFSGCAADVEASFETITFLAKKADELSLAAVLTIDGSDQKLARTIAANTFSCRPEVYRMDSMQSVREDEIEDGVTYLSIMEENLEVLKKALSSK